MICCYHTVAKKQMCKEIFPKFFAFLSYYHYTLPEIVDYIIREFSYRVQDTTTVVHRKIGICIACEITVLTNPGYRVYNYDLI